VIMVVRHDQRILKEPRCVGFLRHPDLGNGDGDGVGDEVAIVVLADCA
jgi:hypothetical protein